MRGSGSKDKTAQSSLSARAWDGLIIFFFKTVIPLIPIAAVFFLLSYVINMEISGSYDGDVTGLGAITLVLVENDDRLTGSMILRQDRFQIIEGKVLEDKHLQIRLAKNSESAISGVLPAQAQAQAASTQNRASQPTQIAGEPENADQLFIDAIKDQNEITGKLEFKGQTRSFTASRSAFSAFFGTRWINRALKPFGLKI